ncbi:MAG: ATP-binding protein [Bacteroidaceae bacterium]|nr:ATP-binding protein [Bacteroidaceae bacterium]
MEQYLERIIEGQIDDTLKSSGAVLVAGPKFCGKTTTAERFAKSKIKLNTNSVISIAQMEPRSILEGDTPRLIDEWQTVPDLWNVVREEVDNRQHFGQFILTGSSTPAEKTKIHHSGAGRIAPIIMRPMSLFESNDSRATVSLSALFDNPEMMVFDLNEKHTLDDMAFYMCRGGWPLSLHASRDVALNVTKNYYKGLFNFENSDNEKFRGKKPEVLQMILRSYARNISTEASFSTIQADVISNDNRSMNERTLDDYIEALRDLYIIEDISAWNPNLRSKVVARTTSTRHFFDTSIACAALSVTPSKLMKDLNTFGLFFEDMVVRDLKVYTLALHGEVRHYRDSRGLECDAVVHLEDGRWAMIEIKLGGDKLIEEGASNMVRIKDDLQGKGPDLMMIITATGPAYRRKDGIYVVPLNCLKP